MARGFILGPFDFKSKVGRMALRFLVIEGNNKTGRENRRKSFGMIPAEGYAAALQYVAGKEPIICDIAFPADKGANLPDAAGLESYDGICLTGSALHIYHGGEEVQPQIDLMRAVYRSGVPAFGSCWGLQIGAAAAGGTVIANPKKREVGFARKIMPTALGAQHALLAGRPASFDAPAVHLDIVAAPTKDCVILAFNDVTPMQAAEIRHEGGVFWGVQYHPEFSLDEMASIIGFLGPLMLKEGFFASEDDHASYVKDLRDLHADPARQDLAWRFGLGPDVLDPACRLTEISNFLNYRVRPMQSKRGRA
jgi:GMP synthase (glutamine-hydrolysing)